MLARRFQSTRPRGARRGMGEAVCGLQSVSIHAPAWGATSRDVRQEPIHDVSIHAPAWGATVVIPGNLPPASCFNPRARVGRDLSAFLARENSIVSIHAPAWGATKFGPDARKLGLVSIHAPAWGATQAHQHGAMMMVRFNPRARVGRDPNSVPPVIEMPGFQSTRPRGARLGLRGTGSPRQTGFNPRARVGRDGYGLRPADGELWFQSTRPRGARRIAPSAPSRVERVSIHAPAWGATRGARSVHGVRVVSIHAPAWGAT